MRNAALPALVLAAACIGCGETAASAAGDTYVLRSIAGDALPAVFTESDAVRVRILADTLVLADDRTGHEVQRLETLTAVDGSLHTYRSVVTLTWSVRDGRLEIAYDCPDFASCIAPPHLAGAATAAGLTFDQSLGRAPLVFERIPG
jgi:hypothetical protein